MRGKDINYFYLLVLGTEINKKIHCSGIYNRQWIYAKDFLLEINIDWMSAWPHLHKPGLQF